MPRPIQWITYLVPARYFVALLKGIYLKGVGLEILAGATRCCWRSSPWSMVLLANREVQEEAG